MYYEIMERPTSRNKLPLTLHLNYSSWLETFTNIAKMSHFFVLWGKQFRFLPNSTLNRLSLEIGHIWKKLNRKVLEIVIPHYGFLSNSRSDRTFSHY